MSDRRPSEPSPAANAVERTPAGASLADIVLARRPGELGAAIAIALAVTAIYLATAPPSQPIDYFVRLADAFLHGRLALNEAPSWLNELIPADGGWYVPYPPMPAILLVPLVAVFGTDLPQQVVSSVVGGASAGVMYLAVGRLGLVGWPRLGLVAVFALGTVLWWGASEGSAWLFAQAVAVLFAALALLLATHRRWLFVVGLLVGCATIARLPVGLTAPFFLALAIGLPLPFGRRDIRGAIRPAILFAAGLAIPMGVNVLYNLARWGTPIDVGYVLIPGVLEDPIYADHGILSIHYIPRHIHAIFLRSFDFQAEFPWFRPSWWGLALFLTTPLYLWLATAPFRDSRVRWALVGTALAAIPIVTHGNVGIAQWGYRFSLDVQVLLFAILALALARHTSRLAVLAGGLAILVNLYGVVAIRNGFVAY
ncbi:MAG: hypothetical protein MUC54_03570 [Chloroflexi bacterium]|jgi:hypothetical protein|nr:hypothetical protein [Chloroflexota bacterium]